MEIKYNVQAPPKKAFNGGAKSEEVKAIEDFLTSGNAKNMCFEYGTEKEAKTKLSTVSSHKRKWNEKNPKKYDAYRVCRCSEELLFQQEEGRCGVGKSSK
jgi:hypothetical protein